MVIRPGRLRSPVVGDGGYLGGLVGGGFTGFGAHGRVRGRLLAERRNRQKAQCGCQGSRIRAMRMVIPYRRV